MLGLLILAAHAAEQALIVVENRGGSAELPYYQALGLPPRDQDAPTPHIELPPQQDHRYSEADMLPVRSAHLSPGDVARREIRAPGLTSVFLVGDDDRSRLWLERRAPNLRDLGAVGLVVQVESPEALASLRAVAPDLPLVPVSGDDLAQRLGLRHYPVLITATGIEQ
nr:integrating conjugative element protein [Sinimarinibacterium flocculans]